MVFFPEPYPRSIDKIKVELYAPNSATKSDLYLYFYLKEVLI